jgi:phosphoglycolate phosphatase
VRRLLVLWDVDYTLIDAGGVGQELYKIVFGEMFGRPMPRTGSMAGRTDRAIINEVMSLAGEDGLAEEFYKAVAARAPRMADLVLHRARVLPGVTTVLATLAGTSGAPAAASSPAVVQSVLTGNMRALAEVKLGPLDLTRYLSLEAGAYGDAHEVRADLVPIARRNAERACGYSFDGASTVLIGDTPLDIGAALATGARAVGVATGHFTAADLATAGAHAVLPDLTDSGLVLAAISGDPVP